ncbi:MAG: hypothetical protein PHE66_12175 [Syntrophaceticus schinkii]|nr:hypothetical protein [Syntrophaceticus schinkii]
MSRKKLAAPGSDSLPLAVLVLVCLWNTPHTPVIQKYEYSLTGYSEALQPEGGRSQVRCAFEMG